MHVPTLVVVGDEDDDCLQPGILKKHHPACGLSVFRTGHTLNLEEPAAFTHWSRVHRPGRSRPLGRAIRARSRPDHAHHVTRWTPLIDADRLWAG